MSEHIEKKSGPFPRFGGSTILRGLEDAADRLIEKAEWLLRPAEKRVGAQLFGSPAGKSRIANRLILLFPAHTTYVEAFAGGAAVFWAKEKVATAAPGGNLVWRVVQSLVLSKERFSKEAEATKWVREHGFNVWQGAPDETGASWRYRQSNPEEFDAKSFRTITLTEGVKAVVGALRKTEKELSAAQQKECDAETASIAASKKTAAAQQRHKFKPAKYTHKNGHPRCLICGDEEATGGWCNAAAPDRAVSQTALDKLESGEEWVEREVRFLPIEKKEQDKQIVFGIVAEPDEVDSQRDTIREPVIEIAAHKWLARFQNRGVMHRRIVNSKIEIYESYIAPVDFDIGGEHVKKGSWLLMYHILDDKLWALIKSGKLTGFSLGGVGRRVPQ